MSIAKPWLFLPANLAHAFSAAGIDLFSLMLGSDVTPAWQPYRFKNLVFKNRLGLAGGMDKNCDHLLSWQRLGCGFVEIGTITPQPQKPNPGKIIDRDNSTFTVWNKMGFPSAGAEDVFFNLKKVKTEVSCPVFINIGKNRTTDNAQAYQDYNFLLSRFATVADAFVINISSPNTTGLRDLASRENFLNFLKPIMQHYQELSLQTPLFLKLSPDLEASDLENIIMTSLELGLDGFILTNTTLSRTPEQKFPLDGGVSGLALKDRSIQALKQAKMLLERENQKKCLISVGGVMTAADVFERIELGADLVQVYSTLIFEGPGFFRKVANIAKLERKF